MTRVLSRRGFVRLAGTSILGSVAPFYAPCSVSSADAEPSSPARTFYVSSLGDDDSDGLSPDTAWATIQRANASLPLGGSILLFRRGDVFYGELAPPAHCEVGAYGIGSKPVLTMFKLMNRAESWNQFSETIWRINLGSPASHDGYTATDNSNIGFLLVDGQVKPRLKFSASELSEPWDFYCDIPNHTLYVTAAANPTSLAADIRAAPTGGQGCIIHCGAGSLDIHDVHVTGTGAHGIWGASTDVHVHDCLIDLIGGAELNGKRIRYGNGIENWVNSRRWLIEGNEISEVYDVAWSAQGTAGASGGWGDLTFRRNHVHDCTQSLEFWSAGTDAATGYQRILIEDNIFERAGNSAFANERPDQSVRVHLLTYQWQTPADITVRNNIFDGAHSAYSYHAFEPVGLVSQGNAIRLTAETKLQYQRVETAGEFTAWQQATGREAGSFITVLA